MLVKYLPTKFEISCHIALYGGMFEVGRLYLKKLLPTNRVKLPTEQFLNYQHNAVLLIRGWEYMALTDTQIKNIKAGDKPRKYSDGGGLYLLVPTVGNKLWQMAYRYQQKQKTLSFGAYPTISLKEARERREDAKKLLVNGVDPSEYKKTVKATVHAESYNTFEIIACEWLTKQKEVWTEKHEATIRARLKSYIFPLLGAKPINTITAPELLDVLRKIEGRGTIETAHRILQILGQVFRYAIVTGRAERNPASDLRGALTPVKKRNFPALTDPKEVGYLLQSIDSYEGNFIVRAALRLAPYVFLRSSELRLAEWEEINFIKSEWKIPASRMKMKETHIVPLSNQAVEIFKELKPYTGHSKYVFPSMRSNVRVISDMTLLAALRRLGYTKEQMVVHSFRSIASTLLHENGFAHSWIERQLAHGECNKVAAAYNHAQYLPERKRMMQEYADYLDALKAEAITKVIHLRVNE